MPEDSTIEDIMYELNLMSKVMEGINDANEGRVITNEELLQEIDLWAKSYGQQGQETI